MQATKFKFVVGILFIFLHLIVPSFGQTGATFYWTADGWTDGTNLITEVYHTDQIKVGMYFLSYIF